jgi:hypothetical protein
MLVLSDRLDALERAIGTVRRRGMALKVLSVASKSGELVLVLRGDPGASIPRRWIAELGALVDVRQISVPTRDTDAFDLSLPNDTPGETQ